jgi:hypothetical protein
MQLLNQEMIQSVIRDHIFDPNDLITRNQIKQELEELDFEKWSNISVEYSNGFSLLIRVLSPFEELWYRF